jgi:hybrid cluster-associated redox disulfide protein
MSLHRDMLVDDVMRRWPATVRCFLSVRMKCIGCPFAVFHTVADACIEHNVIEKEFMRSLEVAIAGGEISLSAQQEASTGADLG